ncbi:MULTISPECIES: rhodanese-like domain-containing protein [Bizionia]|uniref:Rhodanese-like domain-containing protein n=1 Tax=Bizionia algoritergicola TaxID=291187 RepID=A0A5D0R1D9_9FLAO|nr:MULTISPECIES: rhodanese-like domain-containing protein [Bizionia]OBX22442.1 rhodanese [Bizionia sp. APA-3]TYB74661.1 rhodanese-like domain-containing protein [Bizionia algoritergicola]
MKKIIIIIICLFSTVTKAQDSLSNLLKRYNSRNIPYISVQELAMPKTNYKILDAREPNEYQVSHLNNAVFVGYRDFKIENVLNEIPNKNDTIVVYCSLGIRSETISKKLKDEGYTSVYNLYGGIFEWKNNDFPVYNRNNVETDSVHAFSKMWGKWLIKGKKAYN